MGPNDGLSTKSELETALDRLVLEAYANGVDVANGGYSLRHANPDIPDWEVQITRTLKLVNQDR